MGIGYQLRETGQSFADHVDAVLSQMQREIIEAGHGDRPSEATINVTDLSDEQIMIVRDRATAAGIDRIVLVDDQRPARTGTVPRVLLDPQQNAGLADVRAAKLLNEPR